MREQVKVLLKRAGFYPLAWRAYRKLNPSLRARDEREIELYRQLCPPGSLVFDAGAHLGQKSLVFLACGWRVVAIEPNPHCLPSLKSHFGRNDRASIVAAAVGASPGTHDMQIDGTSMLSSLRADWHTKALEDHSWYKPTTVPVRVLRLDDLIEQYGAPYYIKLDLEGYETEALKGLTRFVPLVSFEFHAWEMDRAEECISLLSNAEITAVRARSIDGDWIGPTMGDPKEALLTLKKIGAKGDLFVWRNQAAVAVSQKIDVATS